MTTQYFKECKSMDDVKRLYRELAKKLHPDHGGKKEDMIELTRQYTEVIQEGVKNKYYGDFSSWTNQQKEEMFQKGQQAYHQQYGGYGGYKYNNNANMRQEFYKQRDDPRLADYERMKSAYQEVWDALNKSNITLRELLNEIESLKKKVQTQKRRLEKLKKPKKAKKGGANSRSICL
jgi:curved DNA-binding protein CbpA